MRTIQIRYNDFRAVLIAERLDEIPQKNFRKLIKLAHHDSRNTAALQEIGRILEENVSQFTASQAKAKLNQTKNQLKILNEMEIQKNGSSNYQ